MAIDDKIAEKGFAQALRDDVKALQGKAGLGPAWAPHPWDAIVDYVAILEQRVAELEARK